MVTDRQQQKEQREARIGPRSLGRCGLSVPGCSASPGGGALALGALSAARDYRERGSMMSAQVARVAPNHNLVGRWQEVTARLPEGEQPSSEGVLALDLSEDGARVFLSLFRRAGPEEDAEEVGALVLGSQEADLLGRALLARVPSGEDWPGDRPGCGLIGLRVPPGL